MECWRLLCCCFPSAPMKVPAKPAAPPVATFATEEDPEERKRRAMAQSRGRRPSVSSGSLQDAKTSSKKFVPKSDDAIERIKRAVAGNFMFNSLDTDQQRDVISAMEEKVVRLGDAVIKQGDEGDFFYVVDEGEFDVYTHKSPEAPVFHYTKGNTFGELALMYNSPRAATVVATTDAVLWALDRDTFRRIIVTASKLRSQKYESLLVGMELMSHLTNAEVSVIADALQPAAYRAGDTIIHQGDEDYNAFHFYILMDGECNFVYTDDDGKSSVVGSVGPCGYFGEKALTEKSKRAVSVVAATDVTCLSMDVATFERLMGPFQDIFSRQITSYANASDVHSELQSARTDL
ncbi:hypothetical protein SPRG_00063 [Saprolegnia parasitica CBS 223.65]|uniref:cAMP-dependent protein kinase regulatory subunit n=1 Tax=Saprolegnia parasitica (strain CBS 223.65) TaxID=695850 RepID=A0A067D896_SAPPC|nr:hypothetical protein SPRG_00063 [Saprolegnia parasitica CBS 223.65]KDO35217.1 hypothetical protein SPRG_00063 [Saprolegnia parasitica CBS 223.65]|eukprot:XP_012193569.1 hypothetical protein SPRG_00063 [Saprolegnia parasitica CBS 223.65]